MKTIWKQILGMPGRYEIHMPHDARFLSAGVDPDGSAAVWYELDAETPHHLWRNRSVWVAWTGQDCSHVPEHAFLLGTCAGPALVTHIFAEPEFIRPR